uniref:Uncharacterized protein n=1 Tax=Periophthalmus magnuspinnatus TaxID=409849 RepID=A0A3B4BAZ2_9GOBI
MRIVRSIMISSTPPNPSIPMFITAALLFPRHGIGPFFFLLSHHYIWIKTYCLCSFRYLCYNVVFSSKTDSESCFVSFTHI